MSVSLSVIFFQMTIRVWQRFLGFLMGCSLYSEERNLIDGQFSQESLIIIGTKRKLERTTINLKGLHIHFFCPPFCLTSVTSEKNRQFKDRHYPNQYLPPLPLPNFGQRLFFVQIFQNNLYIFFVIHSFILRLSVDFIFIDNNSHKKMSEIKIILNFWYELDLPYLKNVFKLSVFF